MEFLEHIAGRYYGLGEWVASTPEEVRTAVEAMFARQGDRVRTKAAIGRVGESTGLGVLVDPATGYVALHWCLEEHSLNPEPFPDAPLIPDDGDDDPLHFWMRDAYVSEVVARRAIGEYLATGGRPTSVGWQPWGWEVHELPEWLDDEEREKSVGRYRIIGS
ncbi:hypothetical protein GCM10022243_12690 [Saccharothrix violaceirubra]